MTKDYFELRGWQEICDFLRVTDARTAKRRLQLLGLQLHPYSPVLNVEAYRIASMQASLKD